MIRYAATLDDILAARERIHPFIHRTPVLTCATIDRLAGRRVIFKAEHLQRTGSFKYRGATNAVQALTSADAGVATHSSGNHGQALACAAQVRGVPAYVVMPRTASAVKKAAVLGYGGRITDSGPSNDEREAVCADVMARTGATLIPPYDHPDVIAGQGTACLELLEDVPDLDAVVTPIGGGGLLSGWCLAAKGLRPSIRVFGAEPVQSNIAALSKAAGQQLKIPAPQSIADGLLSTKLGEHTWPVIRDQVERVFTVTEEQIRQAMQLVWERMKQCIEPSAAVGVAVILSDEFRELSAIRSVGVVLCGGNVNVERFFSV